MFMTIPVVKNYYFYYILVTNMNIQESNKMHIRFIFPIYFNIYFLLWNGYIMLKYTLGTFYANFGHKLLSYNIKLCYTARCVDICFKIWYKYVDFNWDFSQALDISCWCQMKGEKTTFFFNYYYYYVTIVGKYG